MIQSIIQRLYKWVLRMLSSLGVCTEFAYQELLRIYNKRNLLRASTVNEYHVELTECPRSVLIIDTESDTEIGEYFSGDEELIVTSTDTISIKKCKDVLRAFYGNPYLQVIVSYDPR